eukprot:scaffold43348_cov65-Phaeocystis_antarctica.AAC.8
MAAEVPTTLWVGYGSRVRGCGVCGGARGVRMRGRMLQAKYRFIYKPVGMNITRRPPQELERQGRTRGYSYQRDCRYIGYTALYSAGPSQRSQRSRGQGTKG